jgi:hypothetical protein
MDFKSLLAQANSNVKHAKRKVAEASEEARAEKRRLLEQLADSHQRDKFDLRRKVYFMCGNCESTNEFKVFKIK